MRKIYVILLWILLVCGSVFANNDTIYLAVNFVNNDISEAKIKDVMDSYGFTVTKINQQDNIGFRVLEGNSDIDIINICQNLKRDTIVDIAHKIYSVEESLKLIDKSDFNSIINAKISLLFHGKKVISLLEQKLNQTKNNKTIFSVLEIIGLLIDENQTNIIIDFYNKNVNNDIIQNVCLNVLANNNNDTIFNFYKSIIQDTFSSSIKNSAIYLLGTIKNGKSRTLLNNIINDKNQSEENKNFAIFASAFQNCSDNLNYLRNKIKNYSNINEDNEDDLEILIISIGLIGDKNDLLLLQTLKNKISDESLEKVIINSETKITIRTESYDTKIISLKNIIYCKQQFNINLISWAIKEIVDNNDLISNNILKQRLIDCWYWNSFIGQPDYENRMLDGNYIPYNLLNIIINKRIKI